MAKNDDETGDYLLTCLNGLTPSGPTGFEGLMRDLLELWTATTFRLSSSGAQHGKDARSDDTSAAVIYAEMKRYGSSDIKVRELLSELREAHVANPHLDLWVLPISREAGEGNIETVVKAATELGIEVLVLDSRASGAGPLQAFCAAHPACTCEFLVKHGENVDAGRLAERVKEIAASTGYDAAAARLGRVLNATLFGFADTRDRMASWLARTVQDSNSAMRAFGQDVAVSDVKHVRITRRKLWDAFNEWRDAGSHQSFVLLGEEGTGKSWAAMSWLLQISSGKDAPLIIPVASKSTYGTDVLWTAAGVLSTALWEEMPRSPDWWRRKLAMWITGDVQKRGILLLFDGMNEAPRAPWAFYLKDVESPQMIGKVSLMFTSREPIWATVRTSAGSSVKEFPTDGYNDEELKEALTGGQVDFGKIPDSLMPLLKKPRYCDMVIRNYEQIVQSEDFTVERLLYEEFRDRQSRKLGQPIDELKFKEILASLATRYVEDAKKGTRTAFKESDIAELASGVADNGKVIQEIIDGGLLVPSGITSARYAVDSRRLVHGLGLLLLEHLSSPISENLAACRAVIQEWLEPHPDLTLKGSILGAAVFHAVMAGSTSPMTRRALWMEWLQCRNLSDEQMESIPAYFPAAAADVLSLVQPAWEGRDEYGIAQERIAQALVLKRDDERVLPHLAQAAVQWMRYIHVHGFWHERTGAQGEDRKEKNKAELEERVGQPVGVADIDVGEWRLRPTQNDGFIQLARLVILVASFGKRKEFMSAILAWAVSRAAMGNHEEYDDVRWLLRLSPDDCWPELAAKVEALARSENAVLRKAALMVCTAVGTQESMQVRESLLADIDQRHASPWIREDGDLCLSYVRLNPEQCLKCLERADIPLHVLMDKVASHSLNPDFTVGDSFKARLAAEVKLPMHAFRATFAFSREDHLFDKAIPVLARFAPATLRALIKQAIESISGRTAEGVNQILIFLPEYSPLCDAADREIIADAMRKLREAGAAWERPTGYNKIERNRFAEAEGTIALAMLAGPDDTIDDVLGRPKHAMDLLPLGGLMELPSAAMVDKLSSRLLTETDPDDIRRITWALAHPDVVLANKSTEVRLADMVEGKEYEARFSAMRYAYVTGNPEVIGRVLAGRTSFMNPIGDRLDRYGVEILSEHGENLPFGDLLLRMPIVNLGYAVDSRGNRPEEVRNYGQLLDGAWRKIVAREGAGGADVPQAEVTLTEFGGIEIHSYSQVEQSNSVDMMSRERGWGGPVSATAKGDIERLLRGDSDDEHIAKVVAFQDRIAAMYRDEVMQWAIAEFNISSIRAFHALEPETVRRWVLSATDTAGPLARKAYALRHLGNGFFQSLAWALVAVDRKLAYSLWGAMRRQIMVRMVHRLAEADLMICLPFIDEDCAESADARKTVLADCHSDLDILIVSNAGAALGRQSWLMEYCRKLVSSDFLQDRATGLMIAACSHVTDISEVEALVSAARIDGTWLVGTAEVALALANRHIWASHWYRLCLETEDAAEAWCYYRLMLEVADRRCWTIMNDLDSKLREVHPWVARRTKAIRAVESATKHAVKENEKETEKTYLGVRLSNPQLAPWSARMLLR